MSKQLCNVNIVHIFFPESLDDLTNLVIKLFSGAEDKNVTVPEFPDHPYSDEHLQVRKKPRVKRKTVQLYFYLRQ